jgi:hypothetical protein
MMELRTLPRWVLPLFALVALYSILLFLRWHQMESQPGSIITPKDPDVWLRLSLVRDWLEGAGWYHHEIARTNAPFGGITTPWTRPLDIVIAAFASLQLDGTFHHRLLVAAQWMPLLWLSLLYAGAYYGLRHLAPSPSLSWFILAMLGCIPLLPTYFGPGNADHHGALAALWVWVVAILLQPARTPLQLYAIGILLGIMLWISPEALALIALVYAIMGWEWLTGLASSNDLQKTSIAAAVVTLLAVALEHPWVDFNIPVYDSVSVVHFCLLALCALSASLLRWAPQPLTARLIYSVIVALVPLAGMGWLFPDFFNGPLVQADPFIREHFLASIAEAQSPLNKDAWYAAGLYLPILLAGSLVAVSFSKPAHSSIACQARVLGGLLLGTAILFTLQLRWNYYVMPLVAMILAASLSHFYSDDALHADGTFWLKNWLRKQSEIRQLFIRLAALCICAALPVLLVGYSPHETQAKQLNQEKGSRSACLDEARRMIFSQQLNRLIPHPHILLAPADIGGEIIFFTPHQIIASNYHREGKGLAYLRKAYQLNTGDKLRQHLMQRSVSAILLCPDYQMTKDSWLKQMWRGESLRGFIPVKRPDKTDSTPRLWVKQED